MIVDGLLGPRMKVESANRHIQNLSDACSAFLKSKPYEIGTKEDLKTGKRLYCLSRIDPVPLSISTIAGDVLHNLRSALDHIAYQAVCVGLGGPPPKPWEIMYPVADSAAEYKFMSRKVKGARQDAIDAIDATKPYRGGNDTIWCINKPDNIDKHRLLLTVMATYQGFNIGAVVENLVRKSAPDWVKNIPVPAMCIREVGPLVPAKAGDDLFGDSIDHKIHEKDNFRFEIAFNEPQLLESKPLISTLKQMANVIDNLVTSFGSVLK